MKEGGYNILNVLIYGHRNGKWVLIWHNIDKGILLRGLVSDRASKSGTDYMFYIYCFQKEKRKVFFHSFCCSGSCSLVKKSLAATKENGKSQWRIRDEKKFAVKGIIISMQKNNNNNTK